MSRPTRAVIDLDALRHNLRRVRAYAPASKVMAIIKADAYGHGLIRTARALHDADAFGVADPVDAHRLRDTGITAPIILLEGPHQVRDLPAIADRDIDIVIHHPHQLDMLASATLPAPLRVWLKLDTGMHRLGFPPGLFKDTCRRLAAMKNVKQPLRLMTHLATANEPDHPLIKQQLDCFDTICGEFQLEKTISNSAAVIAHEATRVDWVRPGLMLYGVSPLTGDTAAEHDLLPVMTLESELISIQHLRQGEPVGYGATWRCPEDMPVGIVAIGYGDGFPRHAVSGTPILVNDARCALLGRASMDMLTVDLRNQRDARIGDRVVLWGESLPIEEIARHADTIPYELLCGVHKRLEFIERGQSQA